MGSEPSTVADSGWELLSRVAAGDGGAFEPLVVRHQDRVVRVCERLLGDVEEARDAAQEAFLKLYRNAASFRPRGQLFTLLYRIAVNHCLNRLRRRKLVRFLRFTDPEDSEQPAIDPADGAPDIGSALVSRERWRLTRKSIDALPVNQRAVLLLIKFEGLSYREAAEVLDITEGAVESRLFRAMRRLEAAQEAGSPRVSRRTGEP